MIEMECLILGPSSQIVPKCIKQFCFTDDLTSSSYSDSGKYSGIKVLTENQMN